MTVVDAKREYIKNWEKGIEKYSVYMSGCVGKEGFEICAWTIST